MFRRRKPYSLNPDREEDIRIQTGAAPHGCEARRGDTDIESHLQNPDVDPEPRVRVPGNPVIPQAKVEEVEGEDISLDHAPDGVEEGIREVELCMTGHGDPGENG